MKTSTALQLAEKQRVNGESDTIARLKDLSRSQIEEERSLRLKAQQGTTRR